MGFWGVGRNIIQVDHDLFKHVLSESTAKSKLQTSNLIFSFNSMLKCLVNPKMINFIMIVSSMHFWLYQIETLLQNIL